jgi:hypothetical protein
LFASSRAAKRRPSIRRTSILFLARSQWKRAHRSVTSATSAVKTLVDLLLKPISVDTCIAWQTVLIRRTGALFRRGLRREDVGRVGISICTVVIAVLLATGVALAAPGDLDPAFDSDGKVNTPIGTNGSTTAYASKYQRPTERFAWLWVFSCCDFTRLHQGPDMNRE